MQAEAGRRRFHYMSSSRAMDDIKDVISESESKATSQTNGKEPTPNTKKSDIQGEDEAYRLRALATDIRDQDDLERDIGRQVCQLFYVTNIELLTSIS